jgi:hypothetical protein
MAYDVLARLPLVIWFMLCGRAMWTKLGAYWAASPAMDTAFVLNALAQVSALAFVLMVILALALRRRAIARMPGLLPKAVAFGGAFSISGLAFFEPVTHSLLVSAVSFGLICLGYAFACYTISISDGPPSRTVIEPDGGGPEAGDERPLCLGPTSALPRLCHRIGRLPAAVTFRPGRGFVGNPYRAAALANAL